MMDLFSAVSTICLAFIEACTDPLQGINSNYGDTCTINSATVSGVDDICEEFEGNDTGDEPTSISTGPSDACIYDEANISGLSSKAKRSRAVGQKFNKQ